MKSGQQESLHQQPSSMDSSDSATTSTRTGSATGSATSDYAYRPLTTKHRRAGSTGTTGDEEYTTDEDELYADEADFAPGPIAQHPILKSDLARAATDLFGYGASAEGRGVDRDEPTSLFDEDEAGYCRDSPAKPAPISIFAYGDASLLPLARATRRASSCSGGNGPVKPTTAPPSDRRPSEEKSAASCPAAAAPRLRASGESPVMSGDGDGDEAEATAAKVVNTDSQSGKDCAEDATGQDIESGTATAPEDDEPPSPTTVQWGRAVAEVKEQAIAKLQDELRRAHEELKLKDEEVARLSRIRQDVEAELEELTASLFQEAHNMVREANQRQANAERLLEESRMKSEMLAAEVAALKTLVLTSTPARPNPHLHPQIAAGGGHDEGHAHSHHHHNHHHHHHHNQNGPGPGGAAAAASGGSLFAKKHRRSPSGLRGLGHGCGEASPPDSPQCEQRNSLTCCELPGGGDAAERDAADRERDRDRERKRERYLLNQLVCPEREKEGRYLGLEVDPRVHGEFLRWKASPCVDKADPFVGRIFREDIDLCLDFPNAELGSRVRQAVLDGIIFVEAVSDKAKLGFPKKCALLEAPRQCHYRMRMGDQENQWHCISQICRNRITAVCDFLNYLRYIERGLVKSSVHDVYWEITRLRKEMVLARLGLALSA